MERDGDLILALDQGTTSSRAMLFDLQGQIIDIRQEGTSQSYPRPGWVNQDARQIWESTRDVAVAVIAANSALDRIVAVGVTNQRETTIVWDRATGEPVAPAIVWQSRQSSSVVERLESAGLGPRIQAITGLVPDAYFAATKLIWLFDQIPGLRQRATLGELAFGTVDSWLVWNLTCGREHVTDVTNASRTMLMDLETGSWSTKLLDVLEIPEGILPRIVSSAGELGVVSSSVFGRALPITGIAGDQQAALFGQACFRPGQAKNTYGTGAFVLKNVGAAPKTSRHRLLSTMGWAIPGDTTFALEGAIFNAGSAVQWLRDGLGLFRHTSEIEALAGTVVDAGDVAFVPALTGLGSPDWDPDARGTIVGITRGTTRAHIARATLEALAFQTRDVVDAMVEDSGVPLDELRVDGGAAANNLLLQIQADVLGVPVVRPVITETTALGAAYLAGIGAGVWSGQDQIAGMWQQDRRFIGRWTEAERAARYDRWRDAVTRSLHWAR